VIEISAWWKGLAKELELDIETLDEQMILTKDSEPQ